MAANIFLFDKQKDLSSKMVRAMTLARDAVQAFDAAREILIQSRDGDGSQDSQYDLTAAMVGMQQGDYADNLDAMHESFLEFDSCWGALNNARAAINQACAKHGI